MQVYVTGNKADCVFNLIYSTISLFQGSNTNSLNQTLNKIVIVPPLR